jgi:hypothetical protein
MLEINYIFYYVKLDNYTYYLYNTCYTNKVNKITRLFEYIKILY